MVETQNGSRLRRNRVHLRELVATPAKTVPFSDEPPRPTWFSDEPARPTQIVQQHVSDQPDTVDESNSQSGKGETTQCVASTRSGRRARVPARYQHEQKGHKSARVVHPMNALVNPRTLMRTYNYREHL